MQTVNVKTNAGTGTNTKQIIDDDDSEPLFERKIQNTTEGLAHDCFNWGAEVNPFLIQGFEFD